MESYIVRIRRRDSDDPQKIFGNVENIAREETTEFENTDELMTILSDTPKG